MNLVRHLRAVEASDNPSRFASIRLNQTMLELQSEALTAKARAALDRNEGHLAAHLALASVHAKEAARILGLATNREDSGA